MIDIFLVINQTTKNLILLLMHMTRAGKGKLWWECLSGAFAAVDHRRVSQAFSPQPGKVYFLCDSLVTSRTSV